MRDKARYDVTCDTEPSSSIHQHPVSLSPSGQATSRFACLTYHRLGDREEQYTVSESQLEGQLKFLGSEGYSVGDFEDLETRLASGGRFPPRYVVLTADDGHSSSMRLADLYERYGCHATFFVIRDRSLSRPGYVFPAEIRQLQQRRFTFGTHGATHRKLTFISDWECREELRASKCWLEDLLGLEIRWMAAPGGYLNWRVQRIAEELGYTLIGTCREWMNSPRGLALPGRVNRTNIRRQFSLNVFRRAVEGDALFYLSRQIRAAALALPKQILR